MINVYDRVWCELNFESRKRVLKDYIAFLDSTDEAESLESEEFVVQHFILRAYKEQS